MNLKSIDSSKGYLEATASNGEAIAKEYSWYKEISESEIGIDIDSLKTQTELIETEPLVLELEDGSLNEIEAGPVTIDFTLGAATSALFMNPYEYDYAIDECSGLFLIDGWMFGLDRTNKKVMKWQLSNNRLEGALYAGATPVGVITDTYELGLCFSKDGLSMYTRVADTIKRYVTDSPYNLNGFVHHSTGTIPGTTSVIYNGSLYLSEDELSIFASGRIDTSVREYILTNPGDISTMVVGKSAVHGQTDIYGSGWTKDGRKFLTLDRGSVAVREYNLSNPWDLDTMITGTVKGGVLGSNLSGFAVHPDGHSVMYRNHGYNCFQELTMDTTMLNSSTFYSIDTTAVTNGEVPLKASKGVITNYTGVKNIVGNFELENISEANEKFDIIDLVPTMTSNTTPSGIVTGSDISDPWLAFDDNPDTYASDSANHWLAFDFGELTTIDGYSVRSRNSIGRNFPRAWQVHGWNGTEWILVEDHPNNGDLWTYTKQLLHFKLDTPATYYGFKFTAILSSYTASIIYEIEWNKYVYTSVDTLPTNSKIMEGDTIAIVNPDNSITEMQAGPITETPRNASLNSKYVGANMELVSSLSAKNNENSGNGWAACNVYSKEPIDSSGIWYWEGKMGTLDGTYVMWGISTVCTEQRSYFAAYETGWAAYTPGHTYHNGVGQASVIPVFGINKTIGLSYDYDTGEFSCWIEGVAQGVIYTLPPKTTVYPCFGCYEAEEGTQTLRFDPASFEFLPAGTFNFLTGKEYSVDTSIVTNGEVPLKVFSLKNGVNFNGIEATTDSQLSELITSEINGKEVLATEKIFNDVTFDDIRIKPQVKLSSLEDKMIDLSFDIWKIPS